MEVANIQLAEIETTILQASGKYRTQTAGDIFSISDNLQNIIQGDMESQAHHIQALLTNELDICKGKGNPQANDLYQGNTRCIQLPIL